MRCMIKTIERDKIHSLGEPKEIVVDTYEWEQNGRSGLEYAYHMSKERFERTNQNAYEIFVVKDSEQTEGKTEEELEKFRICTIGYYDFIDYNYEDCIGDRKVEEAAKQIGISKEELYAIIDKPLEKLQEMVREEFTQTEEYRVKKDHEEVISNYKRAKREFAMQFGFTETDYDRCYNVFGQLMNAEYLEYLQQIIKEREEAKKQSKRYRKEAYRSRFQEAMQSPGGFDYSEEEKEILTKFYKVLAKKYHPDANPDVDTQNEMMLLNKLKKSWHIR